MPVVFAEKVKKENGEDKIVIEMDPYMPHDYPNIPEAFGENSLRCLDKFADFMVNTYQKYDFSKYVGDKK